MWFIYVVEYYWNIKRNKVLMPITTYINLGTVMAKETSPRAQCKIPFI